MHGALLKSKKYFLINTFTGHNVIEGLRPRCMCSTPAGDLGIDHPDAQAITIFGWPENPSVFLQRRRRGSRDGQSSWALLVAGLSSHLFLSKRIMDKNDGDGKEVSSDNSPAAIGVDNSLSTSIRNHMHIQSDVPTKYHHSKEDVDELIL